MGIVFATGFEMGAIPLDADENPNSFGVLSGGVGGSYYANVYDYDRWIKKNIAALNLENVYAGIWCTHTSMGNSNAGSLQFVYSGKVVEAHIVSYRVNIYEDGVLRAAGSKVLPASETWFHLQFGVTAAGVFTVRIDGVQDAQWTSSGSQGNVQSVLLESGSFNFYVDNWVIRDDTWPGDVRISWLAPDGDSTPNQWTCTSGSDRYAMVDERPPVDSDYLYSSVDADQEYLTLANWNGTNKVPQAVVQWGRAWKDTAGGQQLRLGLDEGGTLDLATAVNLTTAPAWYSRVRLKAPDGTTDWNETHINALKLVLRSVLP